MFFSPYFKTLSSGKKIAFLAVLCALNVIANFYSVPIMDMQISLTFTIAFISGVLLGPLLGFLVSFLGDLLPIFITGQVYLPFVGIATACIALIAGFVIRLPFHFKGALSLKILIASIICLIVCTCGINSYGFYCLYGMGDTFKNFVLQTFPSLNPSFILYVFYRLFIKGQFLVWGANTVICFCLIPILSVIKPLKTSMV